MNRLGKHHSASPIIAGEKIYLPDDDGTIWVVDAGREFKVLAKNSLPDKFFASPIASDRHFYFRGLQYLWSVGP